MPDEASQRIGQLEEQLRRQQELLAAMSDALGKIGGGMDRLEDSNQRLTALVVERSQSSMAHEVMLTSLLASMGQMIDVDPIQRTVALATHVLDQAEAQDGMGALAAAIERIADTAAELAGRGSA